MINKMPIIQFKIVYNRCLVQFFKFSFENLKKLFQEGRPTPILVISYCFICIVRNLE